MHPIPISTFIQLNDICTVYLPAHFPGKDITSLVAKRVCPSSLVFLGTGWSYTGITVAHLEKSAIAYAHRGLTSCNSKTLFMLWS